jgi:hypothetical protein
MQRSVMVPALPTLQHKQLSATTDVYPQVSGQAAASIRKKFTALFPETHPAFPSPAQVTQQDIPTLRTAGLSQRKAEYIHGLAEKFNSGELSAQMLISASDEELIDKLVAVRGLGRWSVGTSNQIPFFACPTFALQMAAMSLFVGK